MGLGHTLATTMPANPASGRVAEKCGLSCEGAERWRGFDRRWYSVDPEEWEDGTKLGV